MDNNTYTDLLRSIEHWNEYRVPILRISQPDAHLNFQGAMRFYFQDSGQKVATKCVNVTSADTTKDVIDVLIEKFRPDMRMLSVPEYGLYEIHENGDERKLDPDERPLFVQLEWNQDDREGRFLLRRMDEKTKELASQNEEPSLKRKLSKKEKKKQEKIKKQQLKEQEKVVAAANKLANKNNNGKNIDNNIAKKLYNELPETSFTRSISNPEAVMKRRRAQKLEKRLQEFSLEGGQDAGGTLRIFGETINKDVSYKTLLLSTKDTAASVVKQILEKYGKDDEDPNNYCLVQLIVPHSAASNGGSDNNSVHDLTTNSNLLRESILEDHDCPLLINQNHDKSRGILTFHIRHKPADYHKRRKKKPTRAQVQQNPLHPLVVQQLNQRLQMNNNNNIVNNNNFEQYSNQNSPQNSSQTSGSISNQRDVTISNFNPPPPSFETVHSMPTMFTSGSVGAVANSNSNMIPPAFNHQQHQQHSISAATLPPKINNSYHNQINNNLIHDVNGTIQRQNYSQPNMMNHNRQFNNQTYPNSQYPVGQQQMIAPMQQPYVQANDQILPALIQVREDVEDIFLDTVITHVEPTEKLLSFRLSPTYVLYMVSRYRASTLFHPELQAPSRADLFMPFTKKIATLIYNTIEMHKTEPVHLAFWLANSSDLCHFYKQDKHLSYFTQDAQEILNDSILMSFKYLLNCKQQELDFVLDSFFEDGDVLLDFNLEAAMNRISINGTNGTNSLPSITQVVSILNETMATMRKNRVNAALTIQIFSHLFHHISKWLFDRLIGAHDSRNQNFSKYCNRIWGERITRRLEYIRNWAEKLGIEQAADFHLARVNQVALFLSKRYSPRVNLIEVQEACDNCDRLNPIQLRALLQRYQPETPILRGMLDNLLDSINNNLLLQGPVNYPLEEDYELKIPFLIPNDGYSSDMIRYIPGGLLEFVSYLSKIRIRDQELCIFTVQPTSSGFWTVYFKNHQSDTPDIITIKLRKKNNSMGLSIIAARGVGQERLGIYIKNVVKNGSAAMDGRLQAGDQLLEVDGNSLIDITQEAAAELMQRTSPLVTLKIAKQAAIYHNLADIIDSVPTQTIIPTQPIVNQNLNNPIVNSNSNMNYIRNNNININPQQIHHQAKPQSQTTLPPPNSQQAHVLMQPHPVQQHNGQSHSIPSTISPLKSPKKVSWVDTQPHQSLHTLIPPSPAPLAPSPNSQMIDQLPPPQMMIMNDQEDFDRDSQNQINRQHHNNHNDISTNSNDSPIPEPSPPSIDVPSSLQPIKILSHSTDIPLPEATGAQTHDNNYHLNGNSHNNINNNNSNQNDTAAESLTIDDINEVLMSSETHNNWLEDSAGVIGTQEVYNDPRQRIVRAREQTTEDNNNIEHLSFKEKLEMFKTSTKK